MECELFGCIYNDGGYCNYNNAEIKISYARACYDEIRQADIEAELVPVVKGAINALIPVVADCVRAFTDFAISLYKQYPNKRIVWLALYHPKAKVRKKNKSRIIKYFKNII